MIDFTQRLLKTWLAILAIIFTCVIGAILLGKLSRLIYHLFHVYV